MTLEYTKKERTAIDNAWRGLAYRAEITGNDYRLEQALKYERKERRSILTAKVLILREIAWYYRVRPDILEICSASEGIRDGGLIGLDSLFRTEKYTGWLPCSIDSLLTYIDLASEAHKAAMGRWLAETEVKKVA